MRIIALVLLALLITGCARNQTLRTTRIEPVCTALIGPIKYTSTNKKSKRYAGVDLAVDLKRRNQVGMRLNCPEYRL